MICRPSFVAFAERRTLLGLSRQQLADLIGVSMPTVWRWEHEQGSPGRLALMQLDQVLSRLEAEQAAEAV